MVKEQSKRVLDNLADVTAPAPSAADHLVRVGAAWVNKAERAAKAAHVANYTLVLTDAGENVDMNKATAVNVTVPPNVDVALPVGCVVEVTQVGAGQVTIVAGAGVTLRAAVGLKTAAQWAVVRLRQRAANEWVVDGAAAA